MVMMRKVAPRGIMKKPRARSDPAGVLLEITEWHAHMKHLLKMQGTITNEDLAELGDRIRFTEGLIMAYGDRKREDGKQEQRLF